MKGVFSRWGRRPTVEPEAELGDGGPHSSEVYHDAARHFLDVQIRTMEMRDTRIAHYLSAASLALPVTAALLGLSARGSERVNTVAFGTLIGALVCYTVVLMCSAAASQIRGLEYRPDSAMVRQYSEAYSGIYLKQRIANEYEASIAENAWVLVRKARWVGAEALAFYAEGLLLSIAAAAMLLL